MVKFAAALEDEYDAMTPDQLAKLDRVANYFMNPKSPLRSQLTNLRQLALPLSRFPSLAREVQEYAFALLVAHRLEGVHRQIKCFTARGSVVTPALACARVRGTEVSRLSDNPHFIKFVSQRWNSKWKQSPINQLLVGTGKFSMTQVCHMAFKDKFSRLYQYSEDSQFEDSSFSAKAIVDFKVETERNFTVLPTSACSTAGVH